MMKSRLLTLLVVFFSLSVFAKTEQLHENDLPWMVAVLHNDNFWCAGAAIGPRYVITAAQCVTSVLNRVVQPADIYSPAGFQVAQGPNWSESRTTNVAAIFVHPDYNTPYPLEHDIAILILVEDLPEPFAIIPLVTSLEVEELEAPGRGLYVSGWNSPNGLRAERESMGSYATYLVQEFAKCQKMIGPYGQISNGSFCAFQTESNPSGPCSLFNSGVPIFAAVNRRVINSKNPFEQDFLTTYFLVGLGSWGVTSMRDAQGQCHEREPSIFTSIFSEIGWIISTMNEHAIGLSRPEPYQCYFNGERYPIGRVWTIPNSDLFCRCMDSGVMCSQKTTPSPPTTPSSPPTAPSPPTTPSPATYPTKTPARPTSPATTTAQPPTTACKPNAQGLICSGHGQCEANQCRCTDGYFGTFCEYHPCNITSTCMHEGVCTPTQSEPYFQCTCAQGWQGPNCEQAVPELPKVCEQTPNVCQNGVCEPSDQPPFYTCRCDPGFSGPQCANITCTPGTNAPCVHGTCSDIPGYESRCVCEQGYIGQLCNIPSCQTMRCGVGEECVISQGVGAVCKRRSRCPRCIFGTCIERTGRCECFEGYTGAQCATPISATTIPPSTTAPAPTPRPSPPVQTQPPTTAPVQISTAQPQTAILNLTLSLNDMKSTLTPAERQHLLQRLSQILNISAESIQWNEGQGQVPTEASPKHVRALKFTPPKRTRRPLQATTNQQPEGPSNTTLSIAVSLEKVEEIIKLLQNYTAPELSEILGVNVTRLIAEYHSINSTKNTTNSIDLIGVPIDPTTSPTPPASQLPSTTLTTIKPPAKPASQPPPPSPPSPTSTPETQTITSSNSNTSAPPPSDTTPPPSDETKDTATITTAPSTSTQNTSTSSTSSPSSPPSASVQSEPHPPVLEPSVSRTNSTPSDAPVPFPASTTDAVPKTPTETQNTETETVASPPNEAQDTQPIVSTPNDPTVAPDHTQTSSPTTPSSPHSNTTNSTTGKRQVEDEPHKKDSSSSSSENIIQASTITVASIVGGVLILITLYVIQRKRTRAPVGQARRNPASVVLPPIGSQATYTRPQTIHTPPHSPYDLGPSSSSRFTV